MKTLTIIIGMMLLSLVSYTQTYKSAYVIESKINVVTVTQERTIIISDKEISISNFNNGNKETLYLVVNKTEEKEDTWDGMGKYYYCTTKDKDPINGSQKAIVIKYNDKILLGLFAGEIDVYKYQFSISKY
ncbi:MAG: hypothetical protein Q8O72_05535 [Bacteroidales bacterium]|nr:hypothetical protein [Bacteroidales bacterium]